MAHVEDINVGIVGTGFIGEGLARHLEHLNGFRVASILTRRNPGDVHRLATGDTDRFFDSGLDVVVECSGDPIYGTDTVYEAFEHNLPVVTMNSELQTLSGSWLRDMGALSEAEGDQPGSLAALHRDAESMGFTPLVYGNIKGYLNHNPGKADMRKWSKINGTSIPQTTAFTDGTKVQIEQVLVANGLGAGVAQRGLIGPQADSVPAGGSMLAEKAVELGFPIADYLLQGSTRLSPGVFITATHGSASDALRYFKLGEGPYYTLERPFHNCHLEIPKTIKDIMRGVVLLDNGSRPSAQVVAIAKANIKPGTYLDRGLGSFIVRGEAARIAEYPDAVPVSLLADATFERHIEPGQIVTFQDVVLPDSLAKKAWLSTLNRVMAPSAVQSAA